MSVTNTINKQVFDFTCPDELMARQMQQEIIPNTIHILDDIINDILTKEFDKEEYLLIDTIEIDLGNIAIEDFGNDEMLQHFKGALKQEISALNNKQNLTENDEVLSSSEAELQMMIAFLSSGNFPWWADKTAQVNIDEMLKKLAREKPEEIKSFLLKQNRASIVDRLAKQFKLSARSAIDSLVPGFISQSVVKTTFGGGEYEIAIKESSSKILEKLASKTGKKRIRWGEEYKTILLEKLLKQSFYSWSKSLQSLNIFPEYELEKIKLFYSRKNRNKRREAIEVLKKLSVFQVEFLLQSASGFYDTKESEQENITLENELPADNFLDTAGIKVAEEIFSSENVHVNTEKKISDAHQPLHQRMEEYDVDETNDLQDIEDFKTKLSDTKNQSDNNVNDTKEIFVNEFSTETTDGNSLVEESVLHNIAAPVNNTFYEGNKSEEFFINNNEDQFSIFSNKQEINNYTGGTLNNSELSNTNKISYNNQNKETETKKISSENKTEDSNIYNAKNFEDNLFSNTNRLSGNDEIKLNLRETISPEKEREKTNKNDSKNLDPGFSDVNNLLENDQIKSNKNNEISTDNGTEQPNSNDATQALKNFFNTNSLVENDKIKSNESNEISIDKQIEQTNSNDAKNFEQSLLYKVNSSIENNDTQSNQHQIISIENEKELTKKDAVKDVALSLYSDKNISSENNKNKQNPDDRLFHKASDIIPATEENSQEINENEAFLHSDNNIKPGNDNNENKPNGNSETKHFYKDFQQSDIDKKGTSLTDTNPINSSDEDFLTEEKADGKSTNQSVPDKEGNKQFGYKNSETQTNYGDKSSEVFLKNNVRELKNINETKDDYDYKKKSHISYIWNKLGVSNQDLFIEVSLLKEKDLLKLETRFRQFEQALHERKNLLNIITEHPYLFTYDLLQILASLYFKKATTSDSIKELIEKSKIKKSFLSVLSGDISSSKHKFFLAINNLTATEGIVLQDVLKKKLYETENEKKIIKKVLKKLPEETIHLLHFFTQLSGNEVQQLSSLLKKDTSAGSREKPGGFPLTHFTNERQKIHIENAGLCIIATYFPLLFNNLQYLENGIFKNKAIAARALFLTQYIATGQPKSPEYLLQFNKLLCGFEMEESIPASIRLTKKEKMEADDLLGSVIENWETIKNTSRNGFRESFLKRRGVLTENELTWTLQIEGKSYDLLLSTITWGFGIIKLPWMKKHIQVEWQNAR